jgi:hypothetical protein
MTSATVTAAGDGVCRLPQAARKPLPGEGGPGANGAEPEAAPCERGQREDKGTGGRHREGRPIQVRVQTAPSSHQA